MQQNDADKVLEGEIVDEARDGSAPVPAHKDEMKPAPQKNSPAGGWLEMIAAIGGGIVRWLASSPRNTSSGEGNQAGRGGGGGGGKMRRRRGGGR